MIQDPVDSPLGAVDQIHHALWKSRRLEVLEDALHRQRHLLAWLDDDGVTAGDGIGQDTRMGSCPGS